MKVAILAIGDEVIEGKVVNTNSSMIARLLQANGIHVTKHLSVRDDVEEILKGLDYAYEDCNVVITCGGLGPTADDLTKEVCAKYFNEEMVMYEDILKQIENYFTLSRRKMPNINIKQAYFIPESIIIPNNNGTAPGMIYEKMGKVVINLPGPPKELEPMLMKTVIPYLINRNDLKTLTKHYRLMNIGESDSEPLITDLYIKYPHVKIAPYANVGVIDYALTTTENYEKEFSKCCEDFVNILGEFIIGDWTLTIQEIIVKNLKDKQMTISIAESCTGGMLSSSIVDVPGSSEVFLEGMVTYSNEAKIKRLGVKEETLNTYGAVSKETAIEMAKGIKERSNADIGLSITGIAGPSGGTKEKPVGLVYSAICFKQNTYVFENIYGGDRYKVRQRATMQLLYELYKLIR